MSQCPFHTDSVGVSQEGEIEAIKCSACGEYRISRTALTDLKAQAHKAAQAPRGWVDVIARKALISTRDTRAIAS